MKGRERSLLIQKAYEGMKSTQCIDYHVHLIGTEQEKKSNFLHPDLLSWRHPLLHAVFLLFKKAFGISHIEHAGQEALERFAQFACETGGSYCLLAFDGRYPETEKTFFSVSNEYIFNIACRKHDRFFPVASIHPYRLDALELLEKWALRGSHIIKWLPSVMGINLKDPRCLRFYKKMHELNLTLLTHAGGEALFPIVIDQEMGNPLLVRHALDQGVQVIMAHSATLGTSFDTDHPLRTRRKNFDLFLRLMKEARYKNLLFGDIAAVTLIERMRYLEALLTESQKGGLLDGRLINGSDYPVSCIPWAISLRALQFLGFITSKERKGLRQLFRWNPLLFDFVLKRTIRHPKTGVSFPKDLFIRHLFPIREHFPCEGCEGIGR